MSPHSQYSGKSQFLQVPDIGDPRFCWARPGPALQPGSEWQKWLYDTGSLTQLLIKKSDGQFRVELVKEEWIRVGSSELRSRFGPVSATQRFWSRKVVLLGKDTPWVMAHTLIPEHSLQSPLRQVLELQSRPLGEYLFSHPDLIRTDMDITPFVDGCWGRRSLFYLFRKPIMVAEFFLPELLGTN